NYGGRQERGVLLQIDDHLEVARRSFVTGEVANRLQHYWATAVDRLAADRLADALHEVAYLDHGNDDQQYSDRCCHDRQQGTELRRDRPRVFHRLCLRSNNAAIQSRCRRFASQRFSRELGSPSSALTMAPRL